jgi:uncharacterized protein (DUF1697 family)
VLFYSTERDAAKLETTIERAIEQRFQLPVRVIVLDRAAYGRIVKAIPKSWVGNASLRANVPEQEKEEVNVTTLLSTELPLKSRAIP